MPSTSIQSQAQKIILVVTRYFGLWNHFLSLSKVVRILYEGMYARVQEPAEARGVSHIC